MASVAKRKWTYQGAAREAWVVRYKDKSGAHRSRQFDKKKEADVYCRQVENELEAGTHLARASSPTIASITPEFLAYQDERLRNGEIGNGRCEEIHMTFEKYIVPRLGGVKLIDLTAEQLEEWHRAITKEHQLGPRTSRLRLNTISLLYKYAVRRKMAVTDPVPLALDFIGKRPRTPIRTYTLAEVNQLLDGLERRMPKLNDRSWHHLRCAVYLALFCGLRAGEIRALMVHNVDLDAGVLRIRHNRTPHGVLKGPKTPAGVRDVPMPAKLTEMLRDQIERFTVPTEKGWVFTTHKGTPFLPADLTQKKWYPLLVWAGLAKPGERGLHFHALRHFMVSYMLDQKTPIADVSRVAGHRNAAITLGVYTHRISDTMDSTPVESMAGALLGSAAATADCARVAHNGLSA
jgi:integrase